MSKSIDERGRIYLPKDVRERYGDTYRVVELPSHVALFPVDDDPLEGLRDAVGNALEEVDAEELTGRARASIAATAREEAAAQTRDCGDEE